MISQLIFCDDGNLNHAALTCLDYTSHKWQRQNCSFELQGNSNILIDKKVGQQKLLILLSILFIFKSVLKRYVAMLPNLRQMMRRGLSLQ